MSVCVLKLDVTTLAGAQHDTAPTPPTVAPINRCDFITVVRTHRIITVNTETKQACRMLTTDWLLCCLCNQIKRINLLLYLRTTPWRRIGGVDMKDPHVLYLMDELLHSLHCIYLAFIQIRITHAYIHIRMTHRSVVILLSNSSQVLSSAFRKGRTTIFNSIIIIFLFGVT
jgi:hypothetical protein